MADLPRDLDLDLEFDPEREQALDFLLRDVEAFARKIVDPNIDWSGSDLAQIAIIEPLQDGNLKGKTYNEALEFLKQVVRQRNHDGQRRFRRQHADGHRDEPMTDAVADRAAPPERETEDREFRTFIWANVDQLPPDQRDVTRQYYLEGLKVSEIAKRRGTAKSSVTMLLARAATRLRGMLGTDQGGWDL